MPAYAGMTYLEYTCPLSFPRMRESTPLDDHREKRDGCERSGGFLTAGLSITEAVRFGKRAYAYCTVNVPNENASPNAVSPCVTGNRVPVARS